MFFVSYFIAKDHVIDFSFLVFYTLIKYLEMKYLAKNVTYISLVLKKLAYYVQYIYVGFSENFISISPLM